MAGSPLHFPPLLKLLTNKDPELPPPGSTEQIRYCLTTIFPVFTLKMNNSSKKAILVVIGAAHFMMPFMMSAVGVALPVIGYDLGATATQLSLIEAVYVLSLSIFLLTMGRLADIVGRRKIFIFGVVIFTLSTTLASLSTSIAVFIVIRFIQGLGAAMINSAGVAIAVSIFPSCMRSRVISIIAASVYAGISFGPVIGGFLTSHLSWRAIFYMAAPIGLASYILAKMQLKEEWKNAQGESFDWRGCLIYSLGIMLLTIGSANIDHGFWAWAALAGGVLSLLGFVWVESRTRHPLLDVGLLSLNRVFAFSNLAALLNYSSTFGVVLFMSLFMQVVKGMSPSQAGLVLIVQPVVQTVLTPFVGKIADKTSPAMLATIGMGLCAVGLGLAAVISPNTPIEHVIAVFVLLGLGYALFATPNGSVIMGSVNEKVLGVAAGFMSTMRTLGMMFSMIIITVTFSSLMNGEAVTMKTSPQFLASMKIDLIIFSLLCLVGIIFSMYRVQTGNPNKQQEDKTC